MHMGIENNGIPCMMSVTYYRCSDPDDNTKGSTLVNGTDVEVEVDSIDTLYGENVTVLTNDTCDLCTDVRFYMPSMKETG